ncbi:hypothetical protein AOLI_G00238880 [Acnodon oligacanthus]
MLHVECVGQLNGMLFNLFPPSDSDSSLLSFRNCLGISRNRFPLKFRLSMCMVPKCLGKDVSSR